MTNASAEAAPLDARRRFDDWLARLRLAVGGFSVRTKILGIVLGTTLVLGLIVTWQVRTMTTGVLMAELDSRGTAVASDLAARAAEPLLLNDTFALFELLDNSVAHHPDATYAFALDTTGRVVAHTFGEGGFPIELLELHRAADPTRSASTRIRSELGVMHDFTSPIRGGEIGSVRLGLAEERLRGVVGGITTQMLITTGFVGLGGLAAATMLTWLLTRPIIDLVQTTLEVGSGDLSARAVLWSDDEIGALGVAFNRMVDDLAANQETIAAKEAARSRLLEKLIHAQEEERRRIARQLHDSVGQGLTSLSVGIALLAGESTEAATVARRAELQMTVEETLEQVRQLSRDLRPSALDDLGLAAALERHAGDFRRLHPWVSVDLHIDAPDRLPVTAETTLYRIVQEAMTNAARHSSASEISILLSRHNGTVRAIIDDDGSGFDADAVRRSGRGAGIPGMYERAELIGGRLTIESGRKGTTVFVEVPL